jgi:glycosyltransferase involved in cell wall biosynthesis
MAIRIAIVSPIHPVPPDTGSKLRVFHLTRELATAGFRVSLIVCDSVEDHPLDASLANMCEETLVLPSATVRGESSPGKRLWDRAFGEPIPARPQLREALTKALLQWEPDFVQIEKTFTTAHIDIDRLRSGGMRVVLDEGVGVHHLAYEREEELSSGTFARLRNWRRARRLRGYESRLIGRVDAVTAVSEREAAILGDLNPKARVLLVPNGVDIGLLTETAGRARETALFFFGKLGYLPNADAVRYLLTEVLPLLTARGVQADLVLTGGDTPEDILALARANKSVRLLGYVPDIQPHLQRYAIMVNPIRLGAGTRLKLLEAMAAGMACVSTRVGAEGIDVEDGRHVLLADTPSSFADAIERLLDDAALRQELGSQARELVRRQYTWGSCARDLVRFYRDDESSSRLRKKG